MLVGIEGRRSLKELRPGCEMDKEDPGVGLAGCWREATGRYWENDRR